MVQNHTHDAMTVTENMAAQRFEAHIGPHLAVAEYRRDGNTITFTHTEVPEEIEGRGVASALAHTALEQARAQGLTVMPQCPFFATYIRRHPEYANLVPATDCPLQSEG
jgi:predicted GNAT family acetyltransferase